MTADTSSLPPRLVRHCDSCRQVDDHPRHIHVGPGGSVIARHMDCCHNDGCPSGDCEAALRDSGNARGPELVAFLEARMPRGGA